MRGKECPGRYQPIAEQFAHNANSSRARREAAALAAARQERTRVVEKALQDTLAMIIEKVPLSAEHVDRITELVRQAAGNDG